MLNYDSFLMSAAPIVPSHLQAIPAYSRERQPSAPHSHYWDVLANQDLLQEETVGMRTPQCRESGDFLFIQLLVCHNAYIIISSPLLLTLDHSYKYLEYCYMKLYMFTVFCVLFDSCPCVLTSKLQ